ncbi:MAG: sigma-54-dependent Fis family transcriptional regulator [Deltaproteobacteria bacterium]|nr:sigma-54-dependent Fis family transcriptional regulator [Deltaproteobacteria bacterium]MBW2082540.1 sigma-54-dependent Fis family transcriptional regulator [Deltaproteobacteria bacterium]HDM09424.1 sigma-54-dependent Fis family transcriptional regulator [Desulfobacteraceae bacterium]
MRLAVVDDELTVGNRLKRALSDKEFEVEVFQTASDFLEAQGTHPFQVVFLDLRLPDMDGLDVLSRLKPVHEDLEVIIITGYGSIETAIEAIKMGAYHYLTKPFRLDEVRLLAKGAKEKIELREENRRLKESLGHEDVFKGFIGNSRVMQEVFDTIRKVAPINCNVLIQGETGTGKELAARSIHVLSPRKNRPFVSFNCGGFTDELIANELFGHEKGAYTGATATKIGLLESADGGTVFLDEIGEMPLSMQIKLLRVIQDKKILRVGGTKPIDLDIRIVAASNKDLREAICEGSFRNDLYYRLNVVSLSLPRLSERKDDIPLLISHFISKYNKSFGKKTKKISDRALEILMHYDYPGNVRELENIIQRAVALAEGEIIRTRDLPSDLQRLEFKSVLGEGLLSLEEVEKDYIEKVLKKTGFNKSLASKILNLPRTTLWRKMRKYGLMGN